MRPTEALDALAAHLQGHGLTRLYAASSGRIGVLSVAQGVTVWTDGKVLCWRAGDGDTRLPAADPQNAARMLAKLAREQ